jgi:hypothetical protein
MRILSLIFVCSIAFGQTKIDIQRQAGAAVTPQPQVVMIVNGRYIGVKLDASLVYDAANGVLKAAPQSGAFIPPSVEIPAGQIDGLNTTFTLSAVPIGTIWLTRNGLLLNGGADFTISGKTITFAGPAVPQAGDIIQVFYFH